MLCRIAQWDWGHVAHAAGLEFVPKKRPIMHFHTNRPSLNLQASV